MDAISLLLVAPGYFGLTDADMRALAANSNMSQAEVDTITLDSNPTQLKLKYAIVTAAGSGDFMRVIANTYYQQNGQALNFLAQVGENTVINPQSVAAELVERYAEIATIPAPPPAG